MNYPYIDEAICDVSLIKRDTFGENKKNDKESNMFKPQVKKID